MRPAISPTVCAIAALMLGAPALAAQMPMFMGSWNTGLLAGASVPTGTTADSFEAGWTAAGWLSYSPIGGKLAMRAQIQYQHFQGASGTTNSDTEITGGSVELVGLLPAVYLRPYIFAGAGPYWSSGNDSELGLHAGAGFFFNFLSRRLLFEARYLSIGSGGATFHTVPITLGIVF